MNKEQPKTKCYCGHTTYCDCGPKEEPKQETISLEEATPLSEKQLRKMAKQVCNGHQHAMRYQNMLNACFKMGELVLEECTERMYSEEEVIKIVEKSRETGLTAEYLLLTEQFKKK